MVTGPDRFGQTYISHMHTVAVIAICTTRLNNPHTRQATTSGKGTRQAPAGSRAPSVECGNLAPQAACGRRGAARRHFASVPEPHLSPRAARGSGTAMGRDGQRGRVPQPGRRRRRRQNKSLPSLGFLGPYLRSLRLDCGVNKTQATPAAPAPNTAKSIVPGRTKDILYAARRRSVRRAGSTSHPGL
jgi:hypothetical protein